MGFIRGGLAVVTGILLFISLLTGGIFWTVSSSLEYENVQKTAPIIVENFIIEEFSLTQEIQDNAAGLGKIYCSQTNQSEINLSYEGYNFTISCTEIQNNVTELRESLIKSFIEEIYYKDYNCSYWNCFNSSEPPLFLISEKSQKYWKENFYFALTAVIVLTTLLFFLLEKRKNLPITIGSLIAIASLPLLTIQKILSFIPGEFNEISAIFFTQSPQIFSRLIITGIVLIVLGILLKIFGAGFKFYDLFSRFFPKKSQKDSNKKETKENPKNLTKQKTENKK